MKTLLISITFFTLFANAVANADERWNTLNSIQRSSALSALAEYDRESKAIVDGDGTLFRREPRPIILGYEISTSPTPRIKLVVLFPDNVGWPSFMIRYSDSVPENSIESLQQTYESSTPAIIQIGCKIPQGSVWVITQFLPVRTQENVQNIQSIELLDRKSGPLGIVPVLSLDTAYMLRPEFLANPEWFPLLRLAGHSRASWVHCPVLVDLPSFHPPAVRPSRKEVESLILGVTGRGVSGRTSPTGASQPTGHFITQNGGLVVRAYSASSPDDARETTAPPVSRFGF